MTWGLSRIDRAYCWPNGGSLGPRRMDKAKIRWSFICDKTKSGELYGSNRKYYTFNTFWEACLAQATIQAELLRLHGTVAYSLDELDRSFKSGQPDAAQ